MILLSDQGTDRIGLVATLFRSRINPITIPANQTDNGVELDSGFWYLVFALRGQLGLRKLIEGDGDRRDFLVTIGIGLAL